MFRVLWCAIFVMLFSGSLQPAPSVAASVDDEFVFMLCSDEAENKTKNGNDLYYAEIFEKCMLQHQKASKGYVEYINPYQRKILTN